MFPLRSAVLHFCEGMISCAKVSHLLLWERKYGELVIFRVRGNFKTFKKVL